jgi:hypothetical protein
MTGRPTLNHVAISMDPAVLDERGRADVLAFYGDVFGWTEGDNSGEAGNPLILYTGAFGQFVYPRFVRRAVCPKCGTVKPPNSSASCTSTSAARARRSSPA